MTDTLWAYSITPHYAFLGLRPQQVHVVVSLCLGVKAVRGGDFSSGTGLMLLSILLHASPAEPGLRSTHGVS
eukprot:scaffold65887_cov61-Phaeocystis_antarctica.AAC.1